MLSVAASVDFWSQTIIQVQWIYLTIKVENIVRIQGDKEWYRFGWKLAPRGWYDSKGPFWYS